MSRQLATLAATVALAAVAAAAAAPAEGAVVSLRVESATASAPVFDGQVSTLPHAVDGGDGSGPHPCWGPPGAPPTATATGALDDALRGGAISWRGNWDPSFGDFFIDRIGPLSSAPPDNYWSLTVNDRFSSGGCLATVADGDAVRFFYGPMFGATPPPTGGPDGTPEDPKGEGGKAHAPVSGRSTRRLRRVASRAARYLRHAAGVGTEWAALALALRAGERPDLAARALIGDRLGSQRRDGSLDGDVNATAVAVLALERRAPGRAARAARWLLRAQGTDGGFGYRAEAPADVDTTSLATWALAVAERWPAARRGGSFVRGSQSPDGGFPSLPGSPSNSQSTGLAAVALRVSGIGPRAVAVSDGRTALDYLASRSRGDGSIAYARGSSPTPAWTTAQALLGLTARSKLLDFDAGDGHR